MKRNHRVSPAAAAAAPVGRYTRHKSVCRAQALLLWLYRLSTTAGCRPSRGRGWAVDLGKLRWKCGPSLLHPPCISPPLSTRCVCVARSVTQVLPEGRLSPDWYQLHLWALPFSQVAPWFMVVGILIVLVLVFLSGPFLIVLLCGAAAVRWCSWIARGL